MSEERKCYAGCGHAIEQHGPTHCRACSDLDLLGWSHPFETIESLRAEVEALHDQLARMFPPDCAPDVGCMERDKIIISLRAEVEAANARADSWQITSNEVLERTERRIAALTAERDEARSAYEAVRPRLLPCGHPYRMTDQPNNVCPFCELSAIRPLVLTDEVVATIARELSAWLAPGQFIEEQIVRAIRAARGKE